jgi:hypothetical protein
VFEPRELTGSLHLASGDYTSSQKVCWDRSGLVFAASGIDIHWMVLVPTKDKGQDSSVDFSRFSF